LLYLRWSDQYVFKPVHGELRWVEVLAGRSSGCLTPEGLAGHVALLERCWLGLVYEVCAGDPVVVPDPASSRKRGPSPWKGRRMWKRGESALRYRAPFPSRKPLPASSPVLEPACGPVARSVLHSRRSAS